MNYTLTLDQAAAFLGTSRSTLYKWLEAGKVPGKKLGGQWRFAEADLKSLRDGSSEKNSARELAELAAFFQDRLPRAKGRNTMSKSEQTVDPGVDSVADALVWDADDRKASDIHFQPRADGVHLSFRIAGNLEPVRTIGADTALALEQSWVSRGVLSPRSAQQQVFLSRKSGAGESQVQVFVQGLNTIQGRCLTLRITKGGLAFPLSHICSVKEDAARFERWLSLSHGLILLTGRSGSGKTTTLFSCLRHLVETRKADAIFSIEDPVHFRMDGVNQVDVAENDEAAFQTAFEQVMRSAPNVVATTVASPLAARRSLDAAHTGHLVLMTMEAASAQEAVQKFEGLVNEPLKGVPVFVAHQHLTGGEGGRVKAVYTFLE
ncbi:MAG: Flp pilus assembly complex ATPase component TadA [Planctomycetes bacterium]|nr:Flp pilus assembly complex ATPase component TadA [Planctomycetota bacterium]